MNELLLNVLGYNMATGDESRLIGYTFGRLLKTDILNPDFHLRARSDRAKKKTERSVKRKRNITWTLVLHLQLLLINFMINRLIVKSITGSSFRVTSSNSSFRPTNSREESLFNFHK